MLKMKSSAKLCAVKMDKQYHGDETKKAVTIKLEFPNAPLDEVEQGFVSQLSLVYDADDSVRLTDVEYLPVSRHVSNITAKISNRLTLKQMIADSVKLTPLPKRLVKVELKLKGVIEEGLDKLHDMLHDVITVTLDEEEFVAADDGDLTTPPQEPQQQEAA